jgi:hypothetical protein
MPAGISGCAEIRQALGVYVVGAIDPAERSTVDRHLAGCSKCRDELAGLAGLPALLGRVTLEEAERGRRDAATAEAQSPLLLESMLTEAAQRRNASRRRSVLLAVAASVVVFAGGGAGAAALVSAIQAPTSQSQHSVAVGPEWEKVSGRNAATNVIATVKYRRQVWGTEIDTSVSGVSAGTRCQLWVIDSSGRRTLAGGWQEPVIGHGNWYPGSVAVAADSIRAFQLASHGKTLVTVSS